MVIADADVILVSIPLKKPSISGGGDDRRPSTATVVDLAGSALKTDQDVAYMKASALGHNAGRPAYLQPLPGVAAGYRERLFAKISDH